MPNTSHRCTCIKISDMVEALHNLAFDLPVMECLLQLVLSSRPSCTSCLQEFIERVLIELGTIIIIFPQNNDILGGVNHVDESPGGPEWSLPDVPLGWRLVQKHFLPPAFFQLKDHLHNKQLEWLILHLIQEWSMLEIVRHQSCHLQRHSRPQ